MPCIPDKRPIITQRLTLRPYSREDVEALAGLLRDTRISESFMVPEFANPQQAYELAEKLIAFSRPEDDRHLELGIYLQGVLIGFMNDCGIEGTAIELGYVIHPDYWGHGYATEALGALLSALREQGFERVRGGHFQENTASARVMEKCGMAPVEEREYIEYRGKSRLCLYRELCFSLPGSL